MTDCNVSASEPAKRKRGRPLGSSAGKRKKPAPRHDSSDTDQSIASEPCAANSKLFFKYHEALRVYDRTCATTQQLLRRLAALSLLQLKSQQEAVLQQVMEVARKLLMTELELVVWAIHLTRAQCLSDLPLHVTLAVSAFYVKQSLGSDIAAVQVFLEKQNSSFAKSLERWKQVNSKETTSCSFQEVNAMWKELKRPVSEGDTQTVNYNYYVDDILQAGVTPVDQFTSGEASTKWVEDTPLRHMKSMSTAPTAPSYEPVYAKECEDFPFAPMQWFENVPVSPGLLFFNFPSPPASALLQPMEEQHFDPQTHFQAH